MYINKISGVNIGFKGYQHLKNDVGETVLKFNFPYNYNDNETCEVQIFRAIPNDKYNYKVIETPIATIPLKPEGTVVNLQEITNLDKDEAFAYKVIRKDSNGNILFDGADTGVKMHQDNSGEYVFRVHLDNNWKNDKYTPLNADGTEQLDKNGRPIKKDFGYHTVTDFTGNPINDYKYTLVAQKGTKPLVSGPAYLAMPDTFIPGMRYKGFHEDGTGEIIYDSAYQKKMEGMVKTFSNMYGGSIAGFEAVLPDLKKAGFKLLFTTPIANGDDRTSHGYWNKNNMQLAPNIGTSENYDSLMKKEFQNGIKHVFDATLTSEGLEGVHFKYAMRWGEKAQTSKWFRLNALKDSGLGLGVIPNNPDNLRHRIINSPYNYELQNDGSYKISNNENYNASKETLFQIYDGSQVTNDQLNALDKPIDVYRELNAGKDLKINSYDDTLINYVFEINPNEYKNNVEKINELIKKSGKSLELNSPEGTLFVSNFTNFKLTRTGEGYVAWDDNPDMVKINYGISPYDEKELQSIVDPSKRQYEQDMRERASYETQDMAVQVGMYWADKTKKAHELYVAQTIGNLKSSELIAKLIDEGKLPEEARLSDTVLNNILNGEYNLAPKGVLDKNDLTIKALMQLPLDSLEFSENTVGVLSTSYFSNRATSEETIGKTRFDLYKQGNPHLVSEYSGVYNKVNDLFIYELNEFAQSVINNVNDNSDEKLINSDGSYTEYGEYIIDLFGRSIAKYALLKSLAGEDFKYKILNDGTLTYDYEGIKNATSLKALGINANNPLEEAEMLENKIKKGLRKLTEDDVKAVSSSISTSIKGTDTKTFRIAEAIIDKAGLGLDFRLDAAKDVMDIDSIRNRDADFDDTWTKLIAFWSRYVNGVKSVNPNSYIVAEMTNVNEISGDTFGGADAVPYNGWTNVNGVKYNGEPDAMTKFFNETGITSEAAYAYFFTELLTSFSKEFERGEGKSDTHDDFANKYKLLINTRSADYLRNLYTFIGNHDKTRTIHGLAVDMSLYQSTLRYYGNDFNKNHAQRLDVIKVLSGAENISDVPLELRLNVDNLDYFRTVSARAVAQSKLLIDSVMHDIGGVASESDKHLIKDALIDLANGNYLDSKTSEKLTKINIPQIASLENAVKEVARLASKNGNFISDKEISTIIGKVKKLNTDDYAIHGNFYWTEPKSVADTNKAYLAEIMGSSNNFGKYSLYTIQIARMIKNAAAGSNNSEVINRALRDFVNLYDVAKISSNMDNLKMYESSKAAKRKNSYAAKDFRDSLYEAINQAEYKSGKIIQNKDEIVAAVYNSVTEPAIKKQAMMLTFLSAMCGIPTIYTGDEYGDTGYEDKAKNIWLQNRKPSNRTQIESNTKIGNIMSRNRDYTFDSIRNKADLKTLQVGTPYMMDVMVNNKTRDEIIARIEEIEQICKPENGLDPNSQLVKSLRKEQQLLRLERAKVAFMSQDADGNMVVSVFNAAGIEHGNRVDYYKKYGIHTKKEREDFIRKNNIETINPENPYIPIQEKTQLDAIVVGAGVSIPIGMEFVNADARDKARYVVEKINGKIGIVRKEGNKIVNIVMDGITAKHGVLTLKNVKKVCFRGSQVELHNKKYNLNSNSNAYSNISNTQVKSKKNIYV